jgi:Protein of unknown function (DUF3106)
MGEKQDREKREAASEKMRWMKLQFGLRLLAAAAILALPGLVAAQNPHPDRPPQHPQQTHPKQQPPANPNHPPANNYSSAHPNQNPNQNYNNGGNHPDGARNGTGAGYNPTPRRELGIGAARPWVDQMRDLSPQQRDRVLQGSKAFQNLSPDKQAKIRQQFSQWDRMSPMQQSDLRQKEKIWQGLTPGQREHIKNDVLPKWRQMTWDRQQVIKQKLGVLQHMPESARNDRLNDPNFTRGMSDDEKSMLRDLSHTHVGAPDSPTD